MTLAPKTQDKSKLRDNIEAVLMLLRTNYEFTSREIARTLGINENHLSKVLRGTKPGSRQLLAGLELLKELTVYRAKEAEQKRISDLEVELAARKARLEGRPGPVYPAGPGGAMLLNEPASSGPCAPNNPDNVADRRPGRVPSGRKQTEAEKPKPGPAPSSTGAWGANAKAPAFQSRKKKKLS